MKKTPKILIITAGTLLVVAAAGWLISGNYRSLQKTEHYQEAEPQPEEKSAAPSSKPTPELIAEPEINEPEAELIPEPEPEDPVFTIREGAAYLEIDEIEILVVNKVYPLPADYGGPDEKALLAVNEMIQAAAGDGVVLFIVSGYRSYDTQEAIYNRYVSQWGQEYTDRVSARPGHSEHQTGLAYDLNSLERAFADTKEYEWLVQNCAEYGFILRYPENSEWATGYSYEPWHYRYIGDMTLAGEIMESGISLEEFSGLVTEEGQSGYPE